jgi:hypothetical protein
VNELIAHGVSQRYVLDVEPWTHETLDAARSALGASARLDRTGDGAPQHLSMSLPEEAAFGEAIVALSSAGLVVRSCRQERSEVEDAFLTLTQDPT